MNVSKFVTFAIDTFTRCHQNISILMGCQRYMFENFPNGSLETLQIFHGCSVLCEHIHPLHQVPCPRLMFELMKYIFGL